MTPQQEQEQQQEQQQEQEQQQQQSKNQTTSFHYMLKLLKNCSSFHLVLVESSASSYVLIPKMHNADRQRNEVVR
jgi:hypothetical protein